MHQLRVKNVTFNTEIVFRFALSKINIFKIPSNRASQRKIYKEVKRTFLQDLSRKLSFEKIGPRSQCNENLFLRYQYFKYIKNTAKHRSEKLMKFKIEDFSHLISYLVSHISYLSRKSMQKIKNGFYLIFIVGSILLRVEIRKN